MKKVKNNRGVEYHYWYFAHSAGRDGRTARVEWCYLGGQKPTNDGSPSSLIAQMKAIEQAWAGYAKGRRSSPTS
jgi:hypothetical protein